MRASVGCKAPLCDPSFQQEQYRNPVPRLHYAVRPEHRFRHHRRALIVQSRKGSQEWRQTAAILHQEKFTLLYGSYMWEQLSTAHGS